MNLSETLASPEKREKLLLVVAGILLVVIIAPLAWTYYVKDTARQYNKRNRLVADLKVLEADAKNAAETKKRLEALATISLPSNESVAQSAYQNWLLDQAKASGLREIKIDQGSISQVKDFYKRYTMTLNGRASLKQLATFLERFQRKDHLQLIRSVSVRPVRESGEMDVAIKVESIALRQAKPAATLAMRDKPEALSAEDGERMLRTITERALFSTYVPPAPLRVDRPPPPPRRDEFQHNPYCYVTAIVEVNGKPQVWVDVRTEAKKYRLYEGEAFRLDGVRCLVKKIDIDKVGFDVAGELYVVRVGKSFAEPEDN